MERTAPAGLSPREIEVLRLLASGRSNREIAETLFLSARTVERHITNLYAKIGAQGRAEAIAFAHEHRPDLAPPLRVSTATHYVVPATARQQSRRYTDAASAGRSPIVGAVRGIRRKGCVCGRW